MVRASADTTNSSTRAGSADPATVIVDVVADPSIPRRLAAHDRMLRLIRAIEDELSDPSIDDEQRLQNIGERVASFTDDL
ncbi:MAG: hypothetical protein HKO59_12480 [Phycisphaerales bacterium]|nr:hypothetical protein [Phycisphaerae bacterium]NNF41965.1 hypothetical protein [Phycisphaerales bacterium]NNM26778.1 hypothetical protein [Phycisphaerales bacterium]